MGQHFITPFAEKKLCVITSCPQNLLVKMIIKKRAHLPHKLWKSPMWQWRYLQPVCTIKVKYTHEIITAGPRGAFTARRNHCMFSATRWLHLSRDKRCSGIWNFFDPVWVCSTRLLEWPEEKQPRRSSLLQCEAGRRDNMQPRDQDRVKYWNAGPLFYLLALAGDSIGWTHPHANAIRCKGMFCIVFADRLHPVNAASVNSLFSTPEAFWKKCVDALLHSCQESKSA